MNFELSEEQKMLQETARQFVDKEIMPYIQEWDRKGEFDPKLFQRMSELGLWESVFRKNTAEAEWTIIHCDCL